MVALVNQTNTGKVHNVEATAEDDDVFLMRVFDLNNKLVDGLSMCLRSNAVKF